jgi:hypothetical protein
MGRKSMMTPRVLVAAVAMLLATTAGCGSGEAGDPGADADTVALGNHHADSSVVAASPHDESGSPRGRSAEQDHSGAYNLIQEAETAVDDANRRTHDLESRVGDL